VKFKETSIQIATNIDAVIANGNNPFIFSPI